MAGAGWGEELNTLHKEKNIFKWVDVFGQVKFNTQTDYILKALIKEISQF